MRTLLSALTPLVAAGLAFQLAVTLERVSPVPRDGDGQELIYLPSPAQTRVMALGFNSVVADFYWVKALQYFTDPAHAAQHYKNLADILEVVLGIDPDFAYAYKFAGISIPYDQGRFRYRNTKRSTAILERGTARFPDWWELHFVLGYNYLNFHDEPVKGGEQFAIAARLPGAPVYLNAFSARVLAFGGELDRAQAMTEEVLRTTEDEEVRQLMTRRLVDLHVERELRRVEEAARAYRDRVGAFPATVDELHLDPPPDGAITLDAEGTASAPNADRMKPHIHNAQKDFGAID